VEKRQVFHQKVIMKKKIWFRIFILSLSLAAASFAGAQSKKSAPAKPAVPKTAVWQSVNWEIWGVAFSLPPQLKLGSETPENNPSRPDGYFGATRIYEKNPPRGAASAKLELMISITNWKGEKFKIDEENRKLELTPEQMFEIDHSADQRNMQREDSPIEEVEYFEAGGLKGTYVLANEKFAKTTDKTPASRIQVLWQTFRIYRGNVQRISLAFTGQRKELETMKKVIKSLKFA
jgi:hypothetical protein